MDLSVGLADMPVGSDILAEIVLAAVDILAVFAGILAVAVDLVVLDILAVVADLVDIQAVVVDIQVEVAGIQAVVVDIQAVAVDTQAVVVDNPDFDILVVVDIPGFDNLDFDILAVLVDIPDFDILAVQVVQAVQVVVAVDKPVVSSVPHIEPIAEHTLIVHQAEAQSGYLHSSSEATAKTQAYPYQLALQDSVVVVECKVPSPVQLARKHSWRQYWYQEEHTSFPSFPLRAFCTSALQPWRVPWFHGQWTWQSFCQLP